MKEREEEEIKQELLELNFKASSIGIVYWVDAIKYMTANILTYDVMDIYEYIAKKYKSNVKSVERAMRYAIQPAKEKIQEGYHYYDKINVQTFLGLIRFKLM